MENRSHALMAGFFTIALLTLTTVLAIWLGRDKIKRIPYDVVTSSAVSGLNLQAAVRYKGIKVGNVTDIDFDDNNPGQIILRLEIIPDAPVTSSTYATLGYQGVTGIAFVQLDDEGTSKQLLVANHKPDVVPRIPMRPGMMQNLEKRGQAILAQAEELTRRLNTMLDPANQKSLMTAVENMGQAATAWKELPAKFEPTLARLPELADQAKMTMVEVRTLSGNVGKLSNNLNQLTTSLQAEDGPLAKFNLVMDNVGNSLILDTLPKVQSVAGDAKSSLRSFGRLSDSLKERPQSLLFGNPAPAPGPGEPGFVAPK
ncbi:MlaD family protein [Undibacterium sp. TC4M20W]|uniref:MlaD family protein n=1 Tax=unclassified Undibacterium TaxID=2630295 RepID=UPI003BEFACCB